MKTKDFMSERMESLNERIDKSKKEQENIERDLGSLHAEAKVPHPLMIDEVAASFISWLRVQSWEDLGNDFGGYKIGRILAYILDVLCTEIQESTAATIKVDVLRCEKSPILHFNKMLEKSSVSELRELSDRIFNEIEKRLLEESLKELEYGGTKNAD